MRMLVYELGQELVTSLPPPSRLPFRIFVPSRQRGHRRVSDRISIPDRVESSRAESVVLSLFLFLPNRPTFLHSRPRLWPSFNPYTVLSEISLRILFPSNLVKKRGRERERERGRSRRFEFNRKNGTEGEGGKDTGHG